MRLFSICLRAVGLRLYALSLAIRTLFRELGKSPLGQFPPIKWVPISCPTLTLDMGRIHWRGGGGWNYQEGIFRAPWFRVSRIFQKQPPDLLWKMLFLQILQNSPEKTFIIFFHKNSKKQKKEDGSTVFLLRQSRNTIEWYTKTYLHSPIKFYNSFHARKFKNI